MDLASAATWAAVLGTVAAGLGAVAAFGAWATARAANKTGATLAAIEQRRWHADLTPECDIACRVVGSERAELRIALTGPVGLDRLDKLVVNIRDDIQRRAPVVAGGPSFEEISAQVWSPYRFVPGVDGADSNGRSVAPIELPLGDWCAFSLERTQPPPWSSNDHEWWRQQYVGAPLRLTLICNRGSHEAWVVPREVKVEQLVQDVGPGGGGRPPGDH